MGAEAHIDWHAEAASALDWWRDAGVDMLVEDAPRDWLAPAAIPAPPATVEIPADTLPADLAAFLTWRIGAAAPETGWRGPMLAASGPADAAIMVLVDCPEQDDARDGRLLGGAEGRLFDRMLAAIGRSRDTVHLAAVCCRRPVAGRIPVEARDRLTDIARHHVALVGPKRLLVMGGAASRAILGMETAGARGSLRPINHKGGQTSVVASYPPRFLLERPTLKADAWKDLQLLIEGLAE